MRGRLAAKGKQAVPALKREEASMTAKMLRKGMAAALVALLLAFAWTTIETSELAFANTQNGWHTVKGQKFYYKKGEKLTGVQKIGKNYYYFNAKGVMKKGTVKDGSTTYYLGDSGKMEAYQVKSTYYKPTGKKMKAYEAKEYRTLLRAREVAADITKKSDSKATKLLKCFKWVQKGYYHQYRKFRNYEGWAADFANDHFLKTWKGYRSGCCNSDAAAFGYLALAIGYDNVYVGIDSKKGTGGHGCTKINGKFYDPLFAEAKSFSKYYGTKNGGYHFRSVRIMVPSASNGYATSKYVGEKPKASEEEVKASSKNGLAVLNGERYYYQNGKKLKSQWKTWKGAKYYFQKNGAAATGPTKIKGKWYVFADNGKLKKGSKTRVVTIDGEKYQVKANGVAKAGWAAGNTKLYLENGRMATGLSLYKGQVYWFTDKGVYDVAKTQAIRAAAKKEADGSALLKLIGTPGKKSEVTGCNPVFTPDGQDVWGKDLTYTYKNCKVEFLKGDNGITYFRGFRAV